MNTCTDCHKKIGEESSVCEACLDNYPILAARRDYDMGGGHDDNPYDYDTDPFSKHQLYKWEMASLQASDWSVYFRSITS